MAFELTNEQRKYLGLEPISARWKIQQLEAEAFRPESKVYFDGDILKRHIISTDTQYAETQYHELTQDRMLLVRKTPKGKDKKLTSSTLSTRQPVGVYVTADNSGNIFIGNHSSQTTFYDSSWENVKQATQDLKIGASIERFVSESTENHLAEIDIFKKAKRRNVKFKSGDFFVFKLSRTEFGFGRVLLDLHAIKEKGLIPKKHGLNYLMSRPVLIKVFAFISKSKQVELEELVAAPELPSDYIMDNYLFYGDYEVFAYRPLSDDEIKFPMSYGRNLDRQIPNVFLQWGLIHLEKPLNEFDKYLTGENTLLPENSPSRKVFNPFGYYGIGFRPFFNTADIKHSAKNNGQFDFDNCPNYKTQFDLRNPKNQWIRRELMEAFGLMPDASYDDNRRLTNTISASELVGKLK